MVRCAAPKFALCQLAQPKLATRALLACFRTSRPTRITMHTLDEKDLSERLSIGGDIGDSIVEPRVVHDVDCVAAILTLRRGRVTSSSDLSRSHAVFVTASKKVLQTTREWYRDQGLAGVPPIIHWSTISNLAWLKSPAHGTTSKVHQLTAMCGAALKPDRNTWQRFLDHLTKLEESKELDSDESVAILVSSLTEQLLVELEDDDDLDSSSLEEVVDRVRKRYAKQAEEEITEAKGQLRISIQRIEVMQHRQTTIGDKVGRAGSWAIVVVIGAVVVLSGVYFTSLTANAITFLTLISGVSLIRLRRVLEDRLSSWVTRALIGRSSATDSDAE